MMMLHFQITSFYAALLAILSVVWSGLVIAHRVKFKISLGWAQNPVMEKMVRIHGNFHEFIPLALVIMLLCELQNLATSILHLMGMALFLGRLAHAIGIYFYRGSNIFRFIGMCSTFLVLLGGAGFLLAHVPF